MPSNVLKLIKFCSFFSEATLETDMAKRIMLSVIPSVMSKDEMHQFGGFDYKALRAAVNGANDLIKFGSRACVGEMAYYGDNESRYNRPEKETQRISKDKQNAQKLSNDGQYKECLKLCTKSFLDTENWAPSYGREAWGRISHTLYQMVEKLEMLKHIRSEMGKVHSKEARLQLFNKLAKKKVLKKVKCLNSEGSGGALEKGKIYEVEKEDEFDFQLKDQTASWSKARFAEIIFKKVRCTNASKSKGNLITGKIYSVENENDEVYQLAGVDGTWKKNRFEEVSPPEEKPIKSKYDEWAFKQPEPKPTKFNLIGKKVKCIDPSGPGGKGLELGKIYEVVSVDDNNDTIRVKGSTYPYYKSRFQIVEVESEEKSEEKSESKTESYEPQSLIGKKVKCINVAGGGGSGLKIGNIYIVIGQDGRGEESTFRVKDIQTGYKLESDYYQKRFELIDDIKKVKCIKNTGAGEGHLKIGQIYEVESEDSTHYVLKGVKSSWNKNRFEIVEGGKPEEQEPEEKPEEPEQPTPTPDEIVKNKLESGSNLLDLEIETMRDIVVLMNIFDGLAHNTASVMPKVVQEELSEWTKNHPKSLHSMEELKRRYQTRIKNLMDSKEIEDPMTVYKEVQDIVESPENKHIYRDWITRIRNTPDFHKAPILKMRKKELALIKVRKTIKENMTNIEKSLSDMVDLKDQIINTHDKIKREIIVEKFAQTVSKFIGLCSTLQQSGNSIQIHQPELKDSGQALYDYIINSEIIDQMYSFRSNVQYSDQIQGNSEIVNKMHYIKRFMSGLNNVIEKNF